MFSFHKTNRWSNLSRDLKQVPGELYAYHVTNHARFNMAASVALMMRYLQTNSAKFICKTLRNKGKMSHIQQCNKHSNILLFANSTNITVPSVRRLCRNAANYSLFDTHISRRMFSTSTVRLYSSGRKCWKCNKDTSSSSELFFCECGVVQAPIRDMNYFSLFGIDITFDIDEQSLSRMHKDLQMKLHPDKFTLKSEVWFERTSYIIFRTCKIRGHLLMFITSQNFNVDLRMVSTREYPAHTQRNPYSTHIMQNIPTKGNIVAW